MHKKCKLSMKNINNKVQHKQCMYLHLNNTKDYNLCILMQNYMLCMLMHINYMYLRINNIHLRNLNRLMNYCIDNKVINN